MIEVLVMIGVVGALGVRARQRRLGRGVVMGVAGIGWVVLFLLGSAVLGPISLILRWAWLGGVYLYVENAHKGKKAADSWQCPDCRMFNDPGTLVCLCGYENPETA